MTSPFRSARDVAGVLSTYSGAERVLVETALHDSELSRRRRWPSRRARRAR